MRSWAEVDVAEPSHEGTEVRVRACVELFASREPFNMIGARRRPVWESAFLSRFGSKAPRVWLGRSPTRRSFSEGALSL